MKTCVVHCRKEPYDQYIGRPGRYGNMHYVGYCSRCDVVHTRGEAIQQFKLDFLTLPNWLSLLRELQDKRLGCWCKPKACHGDVYVELIEEHLVKNGR